MIRLDKVTYHYPGRGPAVEDLGLAIQDGEWVQVFGASGSGKSTFGYLLNGLAPHFLEGQLFGTVEVNGRMTRNHSVADLFTQVGLVFQNTETQLFNTTVERELAFGLESLGLSPAEIAPRIEETVRLFNLIPLLSRNPHDLSGGEKKRVALAAVWATDPPIVVMDEPFAHLDWGGIRIIRETLRKLHNRGKTIIVLEHRSSVLSDEGGRCLILEKGRLDFDGSMTEAVPLLTRQGLRPHYPSPSAPPSPTGPVVIELKEVHYGRENRTILQNITLNIHEGEAVALIGPNGAGKTTLLKHLNGLLRPEKGSVYLMGKPITGRDPSELASILQLSFQNPHDQFFRYRVRDELVVGARALGREDPIWNAELIDLFNLEDLLDRSPFRLSEGEKKRAALASVLGAKPKVLVLDEPTAGQDGRFRTGLADLLRRLQERGITILMATHDLAFAEAAADRWILLEEGEVTADGPPEDLRMKERLQAQGLIRGRGGWEHV